MLFLARRIVLPATAAAAAASFYSISNSSSDFVEDRTRIPFHLRRKPNNDDDDLLLLNCAARCMLQWCSLPIARAYAYAAYVDKDSILKLQKVTLKTKESYLENLLSGKENGAFGNVTLSLIMARNIAGAHMARGFQNSISNQLMRNGIKLDGIDRHEALSTGRAAALGKTAPGKPSSSHEKLAIDITTTTTTIKSKLERFAKAFEKIDDLKVGDEVSFTWRADGVVETRINNKPLVRSPEDATLTDPTLARALFDVYLGPHSVSKEGQTYISNSLDYMVKNNVVSLADDNHKTRVGTREDFQFFGDAVVHVLRESPFFPLLPLSLSQRLEIKKVDDKQGGGGGAKVSESGHLEGVMNGKKRL